MNLSEEDIQRIVNQQQDNQNIELSLEQLLMQLILNPARLKIVRMNLTDDNGNPIVISENREGTSISEKGFPQEIQENNSFMLDDGLSTQEIIQCQNCKGIIHISSLRRCVCGKTCCLRTGCGKVSRSGQWYCSSWHKFLCVLGFNLR